MEGPLLSRRCGRALEEHIDRITGLGGFDGRLCLHFVRGIGAGGQRSDLLHVVLTATDADGGSAATLRCLCGQVPNPYRGHGREVAR